MPAGGGGAIPVPFYAFQPASAMDGVTTDLNTPVSVGGITVEFSTTGSGPYSVTGDVTGGDAREYFRVGDFVETDTDYLVDLTKIVFITGVTETQITGLASAIPYATPDTVVRWRQIMSVTGYDFLDASKRLLSVYNDGKIWFVQGNGSALTGPTTQYGLAPSASIQAFAVELNSGIANLLVGYATDSDGKILYQKVQKVVAAPSAANDPGEAGTIAIDSDYIYVCVATDTWKRAAISTWP